MPDFRIERVGDAHADGEVAFSMPKYHYCPVCGTELAEQRFHDEVRPACPRCGHVVYYNPTPAVGAVITDGSDVLLVERAFEPKKGGWSLPAGFMEFGERQIDALAREVKEETGLTIWSATLLGTEDAADDPRTHAILISFIVNEWAGEPRPGDDASACRWWSINRLPENMAWRNHVRVLAKAREVLGL